MKYIFMDEEQRERVRQRNSQYYYNNKEKIYQRKTHYKFMDEEQKEKIRQQNLQYYHNNKEEISQRQRIYFREYYRKNRQKIIDNRNGYKTIKPVFNEDEEIFKIIIAEVSVDFN